MEIIVALIAGAAVFLIVLGLQPTPTSQDPLEARLAAFGNTDRQVTLAEVEMSLSFADRVIRPILQKGSKSLTRRTKTNQQQLIQERLNLAGRPWGLTVGGFLALQLFLPAGALVLGIGLGFLLGASTVMKVGIALALAIFGYIIPNMLIGGRIKKRKKEILLSLPSALDLLTISVEAGLGFDAALARVCDKYKNALTQEFQQVLNETRLGRPRLEVLDDMGKRCRVDEQMPGQQEGPQEALDRGSAQPIDMSEPVPPF